MVALQPEQLLPLRIDEDEEGEGKGKGEPEGDEFGWKAEYERCLATPCGQMTLCQAVNCQAKLGLFGETIDQILQDAMQTPRSFCGWSAVQPQLQFLIVDPACRR